jgi:transposase-like protein
MGYKKGGNCPRCKRDYADYPALSRKDNKTYICSDCGVQEALFNFMSPGKPLSPVNRTVL